MPNKPEVDPKAVKRFTRRYSKFVTYSKYGTIIVIAVLLIMFFTLT